VIGSNTSAAHPVLALRMKKAVRNGATLVVADPRKIWLTKIAKRHPQVRPGTDVWLINAMMHTILEEGLQDEDYIRELTVGFDQVRDVVSRYSPEDAEQVTVAFLVGVAAAERGQPVRMFLTKEAVRLALKDGAIGVACEGCPPLPGLAERFAAADGRRLVCPVCVNARKLDAATLVSYAEIAGTVPLFDWIGGEAATVFSY